MRLWTLHTPGFSLTSGRVDHTLSHYYNTVPGAPAAYAELARQVGTDQIIWCCVRPRDRILDDGDVEWILDVPDDEILCIVDSFIWNKILGLKTYPRSLYFQWLDRAPLEEGARVTYLEGQIEEYHSQRAPDGGWWSQLYITDVTNVEEVEGANALLKHPIPRSCFIRDGRC
jgi:hypothetical protein